MKKFYVNFFDAFDGWGELELFPERQFDSFDDAIKMCDKLQEGLPIDNKMMGEHYGVFDVAKRQEVYCRMDNSVHRTLDDSKQARVKKLFNALALGYRLFRISHNDPTCKEELFIEYWDNGSALRSFGWCSALGVPLDRILSIIEDPKEWQVGELNMP